MAPTNTLIARDDSLDEDGTSFAPNMNTIIAVLALLALACFCFWVYVCLRPRKQSHSGDKHLMPTHSKSAHHRQPSISTNFDGPTHNSVYVYDEKHNLIANASSPAGGSIPEIRITFPDEEGSLEKLKGGRVVIVKVGDSGTTVGMEPLNEEFLPPYPTTDNDRFQSLDLDRIGGIKEPKQWS